MEDDDEFGDLYTDVLLPFGATAPPPRQSYPAQPPPEQPQSLSRPIDLNNPQSDEEDADCGDGFRAPSSSIPGLDLGQTLAKPEKADSDSEASKFRAEAAMDTSLKEEEVTFDIEEPGHLATGEDDSAAIIPGLQSNSELAGGSNRDEDEDWDSDESEDDLQIVLNAPMAMERGDGMEDNDDEDDELVIVADGDPNHPMEEQDWCEDSATVSAQAVDGKEAGDGGKAGVGLGAKAGYGIHGYHPFHSQFKYVRPGAVPISGGPASGPGVVPGQARPFTNMGPGPGRGRGDWRPGLKSGTQMQKNFQGWGGNAAGRGFASGLEFTLPSHKTIFDIDIDSLEEKPWKHPSADTSDFFNFGFNEDSWKDYCKQLEHHRIESTMQSKIRVYESGRAEQDYDPDLPPELAAAAGGHEVPHENSVPIKSEVTQSDLSKGSVRVRPPLPAGRAIQVESGYGERLPSIDTRPPRMRDSDAIIEIFLQRSLDDDEPGEDVSNQPDNDIPKGDIGETIDEAEITLGDSDFVDKYSPAGIDQKREQVGQRNPLQNSVRNDTHDRDGVFPFPPEPQMRNGASDAYVSVSPGGDHSPGYEERKKHGRQSDRSLHLSPGRNARDEKNIRDEPEGSVESMDSKNSLSSSPAILRDACNSSNEVRDDGDDQDDTVLADGRSDGEKGNSPSSKIVFHDIPTDGAVKKQKMNTRSEDSFDPEPDDGEDSRAARSSDNSRARSGSSRDHLKRRDGVDEEVIQRHPNRTGSVKRNFEDKEQDIHRRNHDGRPEPERNRMVVKGREDSYPHREFDPSLVHPHMRNDGFDRRKERENSDGPWQRRDDDPNSRKLRTEEPRRRDRGEETGSRHRGKVREGERIDKEELVQSRKQMDNGNRVHHDKDVGPRHRERDDNSKSRYELMDDYHGKRKKEEEQHTRRGYKEEMIQGHRENTNRRKRERDDVLEQRKRDGQPRLRDNNDDHQSARHKDDGWSQRERGEKGRDKEDWLKERHAHEENIPRRERDEGRGVPRGGRVSEDKGWVGHPKVESKGTDKEYQSKETARHGEPSKRRDRTDDESIRGGREDSYARGNQLSNGERRTRQDRTRNERSVNASDDQKITDKKYKDYARRNKESDGGDDNTLVCSKRSQEDTGGQSNATGMKRKKEVASDDEEQQQDSKKGRSKLERWTSHREREFFSKSKSSNVLKLKEPDRNNKAELPLEANTSKLPEEPPKPVETQQPLAEERDSASDLEGKDGDARPLDDRHLDTVEKLKKRSERFKLPMPGDKEIPAIKKVEIEPPVLTKTLTPTDAEVKQERPARKRRWISTANM